MFFFSLCSVLEENKKNSALQLYDDSNDGSTTDESISIIEGERHHHHAHQEETAQDGFETDDLSSPLNAATTAPTASAPQPLQLWMRCTPIEMTILPKRPLPARPYEPHRCQRRTSVAELDRNLFVESFRFLERLNNFLASIYMLQVILLFLTAGSVAILAIIYSRYSACKLEIKDLEQKLYSTKIDKYQIEGNLARCEYLYEMERTPTADDFPQADSNAPVKLSLTATQPLPTETDGQNFDSKPEIQPTRRQTQDETVVESSEKMQTVWMGADDNLIAIEKPRHNTKDKHFLDAECSDDADGSLFSEYNREYCENQKKNRNSDAASHIDQSAKVYATHYSYKAIDDGECNPNKIDFTLGIDHARKILRETNCDDNGTLKYLQKAYENFESSAKTDQTIKRPKSHGKKADKSTAAKLDKAQKINSNVIKVDKYNDDRLPDERNEKHGNRRRADKKSKRNDDNDKENSNRQRKGDRKDDATVTKNYNPDKDKDAGKRIKNERKRDMAKVYDHRHDHHHE